MKKTIEAWFVNYKTTIAGFAVALAAIAKGAESISTAIMAFIDGDPLTVVDFEGTVEAVILALAAFGFFAARDADKSSQDSGIR